MHLKPCEESANKINQELKDNKLIIFVACCSIEYEGRSKSTIGEGDRIIIIKPDTTLLVHTLTGFKPVNWMRNPAEIIAEYKNKKIILRCGRTKKPYENMKVTITNFYDYRTHSSLTDKQELKLRYREKDLQDYLAANPKLIHPKFRLKTREFPSPLGFFDLYGRIGDSYVVVELKVERAGLPAALQIKRYRDWLSQHMNDARGILVAPSITPNAKILLKKEDLTFKKIRVSDLEITRKEDKKTSEGC